MYSGVNSDTASSLNDLKWKHWLSETTVKEENMKASLLAYPWHDLAKGSKRLVFNTDGKFEKWVMRISASGVETPGSLTVKLDDKYLDWKPRGDFDREFYNWEGSTLEAGSHVVEISQGFSPVTGAPIRQICSVEVHEYGKGFRIIKINLDSNNSYIGAYPTFDINGRKTYRPSNEACLMRNMKSNKFCPVCQEGLWLRFLKKVDLIDKLLIENTKVIAVLVPLAHLRPLNSRIQGESLSVKWFFNGVEQIKFDGSLEIEAEIGDWELKVSFSTPEIRLDPKGYTKSNRKFTI